jgi:hypothetical protein
MTAKLGRAIGRRSKKFGDFKKWAWTPHNPLKTLKTTKKTFGKACRFQAIDLEKLGVDLEKLGGRKSVSRENKP